MTIEGFDLLVVEAILHRGRQAFRAQAGAGSDSALLDDVVDPNRKRCFGLA
jgi:hypothetical protein